MLGIRKQIHFDNNATTQVSRPVRKTIKRALKYSWGNASSAYFRGKKSAMLLEKSREEVSKAINAHPHEVYFTSCATEANNAILKTLSETFHPTKKKIISSPTEHASVHQSLEYLQGKGIIVEFCEIDKNGFISLKHLKKLIDNDTFLICCMLANNETGTIQNIAQVSAIAKENGILLFSDCVQAFGKIPIDVKELGVDYATFSAHKLYGPKGTGAMYAKITSPVSPFIHGGHQEEGLRAGTESIHNIAGFATACKSVPKLLQHAPKLEQLKEYFIDQIKTVMPSVQLHSPTQSCLPNTINISFPGIRNSELMLMLDYYGIAVSSGSACSAQLNKPSHVLLAMGLSEKEIDETIRISFGKDTRKADIDYTIKMIRKFLEKRKQ